MSEAVLRIDGGARGNPGPAGAGFVLETSSGEEICVGGRFLGETTNNVAEYQALLLGLEVALARGIDRVVVYSDSELLVKQMNGVYKVKHPNMRPLFARACGLVDRFVSVRVAHVRREQNKRADELANQAMDARRAVGDVGEACEDASGQATLF
jgi:ribonuclease HI